MKASGPATLIIPVAALLGVLLALPADAQGSCGTAHVRVTTGAVSVKGWEKSLVEGNPNLSHFHWSPITGYKQGRQCVTQADTPSNGYRHVRPAAAAPARRNVYVKPVHVPTPAPVRTTATEPAADTSTNLQYAVPTTSFKYAKPIHVPLPARQLPALNTAVALADREVDGKLVATRGEAVLKADPGEPEIAVYPESYRSVASTDATHGGGSSSASKKVYGKVRPF